VIVELNCMQDSRSTKLLNNRTNTAELGDAKAWNAYIHDILTHTDLAQSITHNPIRSVPTAKREKAMVIGSTKKQTLNKKEESTPAFLGHRHRT
jgi:hypothetical protein